jgi:hypothetical protein
MTPRYEWVDGPTCSDSDWERIESILAARGWLSLNRLTTRVLLAYSESGELLGFNILQMMPYVGPLYVKPSARGTGLAEDLVDQMMIFLADIQARGFLAIAQSPHTEKLCLQLGLKKVESPVFIMGGTT